MTAEIPKPAEIRKTKGYLWRRIGSKWPFLVWLGVALLTYQLYQRGVRFERMNGVVIAETEIITASEDGLIQKINVTESDDISPGATVVKIEDAIAKGALELRTRELEFEKIEQTRKYGSLETGYKTELAELTAQKAGDEARLKVLDESLSGLKERAEKLLIPMSQYLEPKEEAEILRNTIPNYEQQFTVLNDAIKTAGEVKDSLNKFNLTTNPELQLLQNQIDRTELKSLNGGKVAKIYYAQGAFVKRGDPIVEIINYKSRGARGFILEEDAQKVSVGMPIFISPTGEATDKIYPGKITYVAPQISSTPDVGAGVSGRVIKGREITCSFDNPDVDILPGQTISIHLEKPGKFKLFSFGKK